MLVSEPFENRSLPLFHRFNVGDLKRAVSGYRAPLEARRRRESAVIWRPLFERLLEAVAQTTEEGWPFQRYPEEWSVDVASVVKEVQARLFGEVTCHYPQRADSNFGALFQAVCQALEDPGGLSGREVGLVRSILEQSERKYGPVGSISRREAVASVQLELAGEDRRQSTLDSLSAYLSEYPDDSALPHDHGILERFPDLSKSLRQKVLWSTGSTLSELFRQGQIRDLSSLLALHGVSSETAGDCVSGWLNELPWLTVRAAERERLGELLGDTTGYFTDDFDVGVLFEKLEPLLRDSLLARYYRYPDRGLGDWFRLSEAEHACLDSPPFLRRARRDRESRTFLGGDVFALRVLGYEAERPLDSALKILSYSRSRLSNSVEKPYLELSRKNALGMALRQLLGFLSFCTTKEVSDFADALSGDPPWSGEPWHGLSAFLEGKEEWFVYPIWHE